MRFFPANASVAVKIYRCPTTGDRKYPDSPTYQTEGSLIKAERKPLDNEGGLFVVSNVLYLNVNTDIQAGDKLDLNGITYYAQKVEALDYVHRPYKIAYVATEA